MLLIGDMSLTFPVLQLVAIIKIVGTVFITAFTALVGYMALKSIHPETDQHVPVVIFICIGYLCARLYMTVFALAVDTCLQIFLMMRAAKPSQWTTFIKDCQE